MPHDCNVVKPKRAPAWDVNAMFAGTRKQPWYARRIGYANDPVTVEALARAAMSDLGDTVYVYVRHWEPEGLPTVVFDSLSGWDVQGDPLPAVRRLLSPEGTQ